MARIHVAGANSGPTPAQTPPDCAVELLTAVLPAGKTTPSPSGCAPGRANLSAISSLTSARQDTS